MNRFEFKKIPEMMSVGQLEKYSGLTKEVIGVLEESGELRVWVTPGGHRKFYKSDLTRVLEIEVED